MDIEIRDALESDADVLLEIYSHYIRNTAVTFEIDVPSVAEFSERISRTKKKFPYICAVRGDRILGYAYAGPFIERCACRFSVELSIYVNPNERGCGVGRLLYETLERRLEEIGIKNMYAHIAVPTCAEDEYLSFDSKKFHERMGFVTVGKFTDCANKFGRWYSLVCMEKMLGTKDKEY